VSVSDGGEAKREVAERERSGEQAESAAHSRSNLYISPTS